MTRVTLLVSQLGFGGAERQTYELVQHLARTDSHDVRCICLSDDLEPYGRMIRELGVPLEVVPRRGSFDVRRVMELRRLIRRHAPHVLHCVHYEAAAYGYAANLGRRRSRYLPSIRSTVIVPRPAKKAIYGRMLRAAPLVVANSHRGAAYVASYFGVPEHRLRVVENGLRFDEIESRASTGGDLRDELGVPAGTPLIGFVGKDSKHKNVRRFLEVARRTEKLAPDARFVLVGFKLGEEDRGRLAIDSERYHLLGVRDDVPRILRSLDVLVMTSNTEGCPNTLIEAASLGVPAVAPDVGDCANVLEPRREALITTSQDPDAYVALVRGALDGALDADDREALRKWVRERYSLDAMVRGTLAAYDEVLDA